MKLREVIKAAGLFPEDFPKASEIAVTLYDSKHRKIESNTLKLDKTIFHDNPKSKKKFKELLEELEKSPLSSFKIFFGQSYFGMFYQSLNYTSFPRGNPVDPFDLD